VRRTLTQMSASTKRHPQPLITFELRPGPEPLVRYRLLASERLTLTGEGR
jgi:hypothetical protein